MKYITLVIGLIFINLFYSQNIHFDNKKFIKGEMLVQVGWKKNIRNVISNAPDNYNVELIKELSKPMRIFLIKFDYNIISHQKFQSWLYKQNEVTIADYNYKVEVRSTIPNDPSFTNQWHHVNSNDADIDSDLAWDITTGGTTATNDDIVVCMLEGGGGNLDHSDLTANRWTNNYETPNDNIDNDGNGYVDDFNGWNTGLNNDDYGTGGHGTNCLGMIGAKGNNGLDVSGANWDVKMMVVNMGGSLTQASVVSAYTYPLVMRQMWNNTNGSQGAFVVATSASWGIDGANPSNYPLWCQFYDTLGLYGILNVGATTNQNLDVDVAGDMPTACASNYMIGVGRTGNQDQTAGGYGVQTIALGAPGINVVTTSGTSGTTTTTGTSFSCPLTAGVIGLAYSIPCPSFMNIVNSSPQNAADLVLQSLLNGTDPKPQLTSKFITGGRLNSFNTINNLMASVCSGNICLAPNNVSVSNITDSSAILNFSSYSSSTETIFYFREAGVNIWDTLYNASSPILIDSLIACSSYEFSFQSVCGTDTSSLTSTQSLNTLGCGNCIDLSYCSSGTSNNEEWIETISIGSYSFTTGDDGGYGDYTGNSNYEMDFEIGSSYPITITPAWLGTQYDEQSQIWIDFNQDGNFDVNELVYDQGTPSQSPASGIITIPSNALYGNTRLRISMASIWTSNIPLPSSCDQFTYGEVEDYCVNIIQGTICGMNVVSSVVNPQCPGIDDGSISVSVSGGASGYTYNWGSSFGVSSSLYGLNNGTYTLVISDSLLCDTTINYNLNYQTILTLSNASNDASCNGLSDGSFSVIASGSSGYLYDWGSGYGTIDSFSGLSAGAYTVNVIDTNGCIASITGTINEPLPINVFTYVIDETFGSDGVINTTVSGGAPPYVLSWTGPSGYSSNNEDIGGLISGDYTLTITDANGCISTENISVGSLVGNQTYKNEIFKIYPNPTDGIFSVVLESNLKGDFTINIFDFLGRVVYKTKADNKAKNVLDISDKSNGIYMIKVSNGENSYQKRVIKNN